MDFSIKNLIESLKFGFSYLGVTVKLTIISVILGMILGLIIAVVRHYKIPVLSQVFAGFITIYQGIPLMVALLIYNLLFSACFDDIATALHLPITARDVDVIIVGYFALSLFAMTTTSESFRGALSSIDRTQFEAGYSVGLSKIQTLRRIILPQMIPVAIPSLINNIVGIIKGTSLVTAIGIVEVMGGSIIPCSVTYSFVEGYTAAALIYWMFTLVIECIAKYIEKFTKRYRKGVV